MKTLAANKRLLLLPQINQLFAELKAAQERTVDVELSTAFEIDGPILEKLSSALANVLQQQVKLHTVVDESLIGGVVIRAGDTVIDGSVRGKLTKLSEKLAS